MKADGTELIYFLIPCILMVVITIGICWILIMRQKNWIGYHDDYVYDRIPYFIRRQATFILVCIVTFLAGAMSMSKGGTGWLFESKFL